MEKKEAKLNSAICFLNLDKKHHVLCWLFTFEICCFSFSPRAEPVWPSPRCGDQHCKQESSFSEADGFRLQSKTSQETAMKRSHKAEVKLEELCLYSYTPKPLQLQSTTNTLMNYNIHFKFPTPPHRQIPKLGAGYARQPRYMVKGTQPLSVSEFEGGEG